MIAFRLVERDGLFSMIERGACLAKKEVVGPKHMLRFDRKPRIALTLRKTSPSQRKFLRGGRLAADHVILRPAPKCREQPIIVANIVAKFLSTLESGEHLCRTPSTRGHERDPSHELKRDLPPVGIGDIVTAQQTNAGIEIAQGTIMSGSLDCLAARHEKKVCGLLPQMRLLGMLGEPLAVFFNPVRIVVLELGESRSMKFDKPRGDDAT